jgi:DNA-binding GntR family transcriptional regulator
VLHEVQGEITRATAAVRGVASSTPDAMRAAIGFHGAVLEALRRGDGEEARAVMVLHLADACRRSLAALRAEAGPGSSNQTDKPRAAETTAHKEETADESA